MLRPLLLKPQAHYCEKVQSTVQNHIIMFADYTTAVSLTATVMSQYSAK